MDNEFNKIFVMLLNGEVDDPNLLSKYLLQLTAHSYNLDKDRIEAERAYSALFNVKRSEYKSDKQCENALTGTTEWEKLEKTKASYRLTKEIIMSAKKRLSVLQDLMRNNY